MGCCFACIAGEDSDYKRWDEEQEKSHASAGVETRAVEEKAVINYVDTDTFKGLFKVMRAPRARPPCP
jgi:hypothetical protein